MLLCCWLQVQLYSQLSYIIEGNEPCPQPQTSEHLAAVEIMQLKNLLILQNKIDLIKESQGKILFDNLHVKFSKRTTRTNQEFCSRYRC